jgi:hypothetical protein
MVSVRITSQGGAEIKPTSGDEFKLKQSQGVALGVLLEHKTYQVLVSVTLAHTILPVLTSLIRSLMTSELWNTRRSGKHFFRTELGTKTVPPFF